MLPTGATYTYTEFGDLARLKNAGSGNSDQALESVARQFEALFTQMIFKSMRNAELSSGLFDNNQTKMYQDILDKQLSSSLSSHKGLGIADLLIRQLSHNPEPASSDKGIAKGVDRTSDTSSKTNVSPIVHFDSPDAYISYMQPIAEKIENRYQIPAQSLLAQSALETGWGKHIMRNNNGSSSFNLFGIKAGNDWDGNVVVSRTIEYESGTAVTKSERFRSYESFEESMNDYARHISSEPRYKEAYEKRSEPEHYFTDLQMAGYATDPEYSNKINRILGRLEAFGNGLT